MVRTETTRLKRLITRLLNVFLMTLLVTYAYVPSMADELNTIKEVLWNHADKGKRLNSEKNLSHYHAVH